MPYWALLKNILYSVSIFLSFYYSTVFCHCCRPSIQTEIKDVMTVKTLTKAEPLSLFSRRRESAFDGIVGISAHHRVKPGICTCRKLQAGN